MAKLSDRLTEFYLKQELLITSWADPLPENTSQADSLHLLINKELLELYQLSAEKATQNNLRPLELLQWELSSHLAHPLENYFWDISIFQEDEKTILALGCALPKQNIEQLTRGITLNIEKISSADQQFILLKNRIPFWQKRNFSKKLSLLLYFVSAILVLLNLGSSLLFAQLQQSTKSSLVAQGELVKQAEQKRTHWQAAKQQQQQITKNLELNQKTLRILESLTTKTPRPITLTRLSLAPQALEISGTTARQESATIYDFARRLGQNSGITNSFIKNSTITQGDLLFNLTAQVNIL